MSDTPIPRPSFVAPPGGAIGRPGGVDVWRLRLSISPSRRATLERHLGGDERERAARYTTPDLVRRFVVRRGMLREILARYLGIGPSDVAFSAGPHGRPRIRAVGGAPAPIDFSASDSGDLALVAVVARESEPVGIDVERVRPVDDADDIAARWFSPSARQALSSARPAERERAFFVGWTRLEAGAKALGVGIGGEGVARAAIDRESDRAFGFEPERGFLGALVAGRTFGDVRWFDAP